MEDIRDFLRAHGWTRLTEDTDLWVKEHELLRLESNLVDVFDAFYMKGFLHGLERVLYEMETMEDADPDALKILEAKREEWRKNKCR